MYFNVKNVRGKKTFSTTNYTKGFVSIEENNLFWVTKNIKKGEKIYNKENLWVNTKPIVYNNVEKGIIPINN